MYNDEFINFPACERLDYLCTTKPCFHHYHLKKCVSLIEEEMILSLAYLCYCFFYYLMRANTY